MTTPDKEEMPTNHMNAGPCLREALALVAGGFEGEGLEIENEWRRSIARNALNGLPLSEYQVSVARRYLSTLPVNDRQTSDDVGILRQALAAARTEADDMRKRWREAENALHQFNYPPDPKMLREVADEIDCGQTCEFGNIEWDTGAHNCSKREREGCPGDNAIQLREFADAIEARAALKGVPQPVSHWTPEMKRAAMTDARNVCELADTLREIEKQCIQADDPEHHTLSLVKHLARHALARLPQPASEAGKLSSEAQS